MLRKWESAPGPANSPHHPLFPGLGLGLGQPARHKQSPMVGAEVGHQKLCMGCFALQARKGLGCSTALVGFGLSMTFGGSAGGRQKAWAALARGWVFPSHGGLGPSSRPQQREDFLPFSLFSLFVCNLFSLIYGLFFQRKRSRCCLVRMAKCLGAAVAWMGRALGEGLRTPFGSSFSSGGGRREPGSVDAEAALGSARALLRLSPGATRSQRRNAVTCSRDVLEQLGSAAQVCRACTSRGKYDTPPITNLFSNF